MINQDVPAAFAASSSPTPPTTTAQLNYQYDLIDDTNSLYSGSDSAPSHAAAANNPSDYIYNDIQAAPAGGSSSLLTAESEDSQLLSASSDALISSRNFNLVNRSSAIAAASGSAEASAMVVDYQTADGEGEQFNIIMESRTNESNEFRVMIVCLGLVVISIGILANLIFSLLVMCKRRRERAGTATRSLSSSLIIMISMSIVYFLFLLSYCLKISVYFSGDNIIKFHIYDIIENWSYGNVMCKLLSALPVSCKLISRLSLLALVLKRLVSYLFTCDLARTHDSPDDSMIESSTSAADADVNIIRPTRPASGIRVKSTRKDNNNRQQRIHRAHQTMSIGRKLARLIRSIFEWPFVSVLIAIVWFACLIASWPLFSSYVVREDVCDSEYRFPEDIRAVQSLWFNYLIYGLVVPLSLVFVLLVSLFILQTDYCASLLNVDPNNSSVSASTFSSSSTSQNSTPNRKLHLKSSSTASFDEINSSNATNKDDQSSSSSSSSSSDVANACYPRRGRSNNLILWVMWAIMLFTSLPQELYRYFQLKIDFNNDEVLSSYLESILMQPIVRARPYYAMQLIYVAEFALMPLVFIVFYTCTIRGSRSSSSTLTTTSTASRRAVSHLQAAATKRNKGLLSRIFYDPELARVITGHSVNSTSHVRRMNAGVISSPLDSTAKNLLFSGGDADTNHYPLLAHHKQYTSTSSEPKLIYSKKLKPTPFELAAHGCSPSEHPFVHNNPPPGFYQGSSNSSTTSSTTNTNTTAAGSGGGAGNAGSNNTGAAASSSSSNVLHIIQHPSWRINIKQQPQQQHYTITNPQHFLVNNNNNNINNNLNNGANLASSHHPDDHMAFNYSKGSLFKN